MIGKNWLIGCAMAVAVGAVAFAQHGSLPAPQVQFAAQQEPVAFELFRGNRIFVPVTINGHRVNAMLDTGASLNVVDEDFARKIGLKSVGTIEGHGTGGVVKSGLAIGVGIDVGGLQLRESAVGIMDLKGVAKGIGHPIDMILGHELFNSAIVSIDWSANKLTVRSPKSYQVPDGAKEIALTKLGRFHTVPIEVDGETVTALLDVGNGGNLSLPKSFWEKRPALANLRYAAGVAGGVGGLHDVRYVTLPSATFAGRRFGGIPTSFGVSDEGHDPTRMANVGIGILRNFKLDLDLGHDRIILQPRSDAPSFERDRAGVRLDLLDDHLRVVFVSPQGPSAPAGLKAGDEIVAVNGVKVGPDYYSAGDWTRGPSGATVALSLADGRTLQVILRDYY